MNKERDSLEEAFFLVNPINPPDFTTETILVNGQEMEVTSCTGEFVGDEPERFHLAMDRAVLARKSEATKAKKVSVLPAARDAKKVKHDERDRDVLAAALAILSKTRARTNWTDLAQAVGKWLKDPPRDWLGEDEKNKVWKRGTSRSSICERLERVKSQLPQTKIGPWKKVSGD